MEEVIQKVKSAMLTGRQGAVDYQLGWDTLMGVLSTREVVLKRYKRNGSYRITDAGVEYVGLFDHTIPDGFRAVQSDEYYWIEEWRDGVCIRYAEISEQYFNDLK